MNAQTESELELRQKLLVAARKLGAHQREQLEAVPLLDRAYEEITRTGVELRKAEYLLAQSELTVSQKNVVFLDAGEYFKELEIIGLAVADELDKARRHLWTVAMGQDNEIIDAAQAYVEAAKVFHTHFPKQLAAVEDIEVAMKELENAKAAHVSLVEKHQVAKQQLRNANITYSELCGKIYCLVSTANLENALVNAAHELTGTEELKVKYDPVDTKDLPINLNGN